MIVGRETGNAGSAIVVRGYDVTVSTLWHDVLCRYGLWLSVYSMQSFAFHYSHPGLHSGYGLRGVTEKCESPLYSEHGSASKMAASIGGRHLHLKEQLCLAEMVFQNGGLHRGGGGCHLQSKRQFWLVAPVAILEEPFTSFLSTLKLELPPRQTLNANWAKNHYGLDSEPYLERSTGLRWAVK